MAFTLAAPFPALQTISILPSPTFTDGEALTAEVNATRAMDGTLYTYVKDKNGRKKLTWSFRLRRPKALEVMAFFRQYHATECQVTDHRGRIWRGHFVNNPFELDALKRAGPAAYGVAGELNTISLDFEGFRIA